MSVKVMPTIRNNITLRSRASRWIECRLDCSSFVCGNPAISHAECKVELTEHNVDGARKVRGWREDTECGQYLANSVWLFMGVLGGEN